MSDDSDSLSKRGRTRKHKDQRPTTTSNSIRTTTTTTTSATPSQPRSWIPVLRRIDIGENWRGSYCAPFNLEPNLILTDIFVPQTNGLAAIIGSPYSTPGCIG